MRWTVKNYDCNRDKIIDYDLFPYFKKFLLKLKKEKKTREDFAKEIRSELMYHYWSRCQYELVIEQAEDGRIYLLPWVGCRDENIAAVDVTDYTDFDWIGFADKHIKNQIYGNKAKIDIWNQVEYRFDDFVSYCWDLVHKKKKEIPQKLNRYFYIIEEDNGKRVIHMQGNVYFNDADASDYDYRTAEWTSLYFDIDEAKYMFDTDTFYEYVDERIYYLEDVSEAKAHEICLHYFNGKPGKELHIYDIKDNTPCGDYWFDV